MPFYFLINNIIQMEVVITHYKNYPKKATTEIRYEDVVGKIVAAHKHKDAHKDKGKKT